MQLFTFQKWAENTVDHFVTFMYQFPVTFREVKMCNVEKTEKGPLLTNRNESGKSSRCSAEVAVRG